MKTLWLRCWIRMSRSIQSVGFIKLLLVLLFPVLIGMVMLRNDYSLKEDLYRLFVFSAITAAWWYIFVEKRSPHA